MPASLVRIERWPVIMRDQVRKNIVAPFQWSASDCSFVFDAIREMTGFDAIEDIRGYGDEGSALRALRKAGFKSVLELVEEKFEEIEPAFAGRGDIGYPATIVHPLMSPAIIDGANAFSKEPRGPVVFPIDKIARAWKV